MKWLGILKILGHPSLLPLGISTFITIAGPGGVAEIELDAPTLTNVPTFESPVVAAPPSQPLVLVLHRVPPKTPIDVPAEPVAEPSVPQVLFDQTEISSLGTLASSEVLPVEAPERTFEQVDDTDGTQPEVPSAPSDSGDQPATSPVDGPDNEPDTGGGENDPGNGGTGSDDGSPAEDEPACDPPGTGPHPHGDVPPGHDQNGDGIDDRCQDAGDETSDPGDSSGGTPGETDDSTGDPGDTSDDAGDGSDSSDGAGDASDGTGDSSDGTGDNGDATGDGDNGTDDGSTGEGDPVDGGTDETGTGDEDAPVCDTPGNGPAPHGDVPPGHDKNEDGIDDRCQEGGSETAGGSYGGQKDKNKREDNTRFTIALLRRI